MSAIEFLWEPMWQRVGVALAHFLWQGLLVAVAVECLVRLLCGRPTSRYAGYLIAMLVAAACPVITFVVLDAPAPTASSPAYPNVAAPWGTPLMGAGSYAAGAAMEPYVGMQSEFDGPGEWSPTWQEWGERLFQCALPWLVVGWLGGVIALSLRTVAGLIAVRRWRRGVVDLPPEMAAQVPALCRRMGMRIQRSVSVSFTASSAMAVGWFEPVVLLPLAMVTQMPPQLLRAVIAHELAHIRRLDAWANLLQRVVEVVLFYHPIVWWLSARIRSQRELCCDELAVQATGEPVAYARALEQAGRADLAGRVGLAGAFGQNDHALLARVQHVLGLVERSRPSGPWLAGAVVLVSVAALAVAAGIACCAPTTQAEDAAVESCEFPDSAPAGAPSPGAARTVHFPKDRSLGVLEVQDDVETPPGIDFMRRASGWTSLGRAMGDVQVPAGKRLRLIVWPAEVDNLSALRQLRPDDLDGLMVFAQGIDGAAKARGPAHRVDIRAIAHMAGLRSLVMCDARRFDLNVLKGMKSLEELYLANVVDRSAELTDADVAIISRLSSLKRLTVGGPRLTDKGLAHVTKLSGLEQLWLYGDRLTPVGVAQLARMPALTVLGLGSERIDDPWLDAVRRIESLRALDLSRQPVTDDGLRRLWGHPNLETLDLSGTRVTDAGMAYLKGLPSLRRLNLGGHTRGRGRRRQAP